MKEIDLLQRLRRWDEVLMSDEGGNMTAVQALTILIQFDIKITVSLLSNMMDTSNFCATHNVHEDPSESSVYEVQITSWRYGRLRAVSSP